jgi:hypothetical protein
MSSNLRIVKICAFCKQEFIAGKTTTETCSDSCAKRLYKLRIREKAKPNFYVNACFMGTLNFQSAENQTYFRVADCRKDDCVQG